jgi:hypothetical protein
MFPGSSSINDCRFHDLRYLNKLGISEDKETVFVGTGNRRGLFTHFWIQ